MIRLKFLSQATLDQLQANIVSHRQRYESGDFLDLETGNGWAIETAGVSMDAAALAALDQSPTNTDVEVRNSIAVFEALPGMTPAVAREERVWARLTHVEALGYSRARWLRGKSGMVLDKLVADHFFGGGLTAIRDDNAIGRLWWNASIARIASGTADIEPVLRLILKRADIRSNLVERSRTISRPKLARALIRVMSVEPWVTSDEESFRHFMKVLNRNGGGILFEVMSDREIDHFMASATASAMKQYAAAMAAAA